MKLNEAKKAVAENRLNDLSVSELKEAEKLLKEAGEDKAAAAVAAQLAAAENDNNEQTVKEFSYDELKDNPDKNNQELKESIELLGNLDIQGTDGKSVDIKNEIVAAAQLKADLSVSEKGGNGETVTLDDYQKEFAKNINAILLGMMQTEAAAHGKGDAEATKQKLDELTTAAQQGQKVTVGLNAAIGTMSNFAEDIDNSIAGLSKKLGNSAFGKSVKARWNKLDTSLRKKLGKPYEKARAYAKVFHEQGGTTAVGMMFVAGFGGPIGLGVYAGYVVKKRVLPFLQKYKKENETNKTSFKDFIKENKKESIKAGLYAASAVAGFVTAGVQAYQNIAQAAGAMQAIDGAVSYTSTAKLLTAAGAAMTEPVTELGIAVKEKKDVGKATKRLLGKAAMFGIGFGANELAHLGMEWYDSHTGEAADAAEAAAAGAAATTPEVTEPAPEVVNNETVNNEVVNEEPAPAVVDEGPAIEVGAREQALYERNLKLVPNSDIMVDNVNEGDVNLPNGMTPEMAVNLARVEYLYYGDDTGLKLLLDCDSVNDVNSIQYFREMSDKFVTQAGDPRGLIGYPTDPNYVADANIHARIKEVDCSGVKIERTVTPGAGTSGTPVVDNGVVDADDGSTVVEEGDTDVVIPGTMQPDNADEVVADVVAGEDVTISGDELGSDEETNVIPVPEADEMVEENPDPDTRANTPKVHVKDAAADAADMEGHNIVLGEDGRFHQLTDEQMAERAAAAKTVVVDDVQDSDTLANTSKEGTHFDHAKDMNDKGGAQKMSVKVGSDGFVRFTTNDGR